MPAKIYYDKDADISLLKNKTIAILGYGSQGHGHAQNLRDSGCNVIVAELPGTANYEQAVKDGFQPISAAEATKKADIITVLLPDEIQGEIFAARLGTTSRPATCWFAPTASTSILASSTCPRASRPFSWRRRGPGTWWAEDVRGAGVPCLIALGEGAGPDALKIGLAYAKGIGGTRTGVIETTFAEETETDLFGEQVVLCGGLSALIKAGYETLVEAGYQPEMAYFECVHEVKLIKGPAGRGNPLGVWPGRTLRRLPPDGPSGSHSRRGRPCRIAPGRAGLWPDRRAFPARDGQGGGGGARPPAATARMAR